MHVSTLIVLTIFASTACRTSSNTAALRDNGAVERSDEEDAVPLHIGSQYTSQLGASLTFDDSGNVTRRKNFADRMPKTGTYTTANEKVSIKWSDGQTEEYTLAQGGNALVVNGEAKYSIILK